MLPQEEAVQTLVNLGFTVLQAKVYIALAKLGTSTGRTTAKAAKVASQDVYRVLTELQEKGFVEKIIAKPNKYRPIPLEEGISMLLQRRDKQTAELKKAVFEMSKSFQIIDKREDKNETGDFVLIPEKEPIENRFIRAWNTAQTSIDVMNNDQETMIMLAREKNYELMVKALKKGVKIREIHDKCQKGNQTKLFLALLKRASGFQARYLDLLSPAKIIIKDNKEVFISTMSKVKTLAQPYLWSNNPVIVQVIQQWYDIMWEKASRECQRVQ